MTEEERDNAIRCVKKWSEEAPYLQTYKTCLEALEQQRWIPVSERLPEKECNVFCARDNGSIIQMHYNPIQTIRYPKGFSMELENGFYWRQNNVIAWMPLPEPYREDGE